MKKQINAMGLACPQPVVLTKKALDNMENCDVLQIYVDNDIAVKNVIKFARSKNLEAAYHQEKEKEYCINIRVSQDAELSETEESLITCGNTLQNIVVLASDKMGEGDSELGVILIKGFIYALTQLENLPNTVIMYNGGAKLAIENSPCLEDLKNLEKSGVEILTCGTCLKHYKIEENLAVGTVTNMYTIAEKMSQAINIIKP